MKWKEAIKNFESSLKINDDHTSTMLIERCKEFIDNPPGKDWDGVREMKTK